MDHEFYTDRLSAYFDMELKNEEFVIVDEHIKQCAECQQLLAELQKLHETIEKQAELHDTDYWEKSAQKIEAVISGEQKTEIIKVPRATYKGLWWKVSGLAASVAILAFVTLYEKDITQDIPTTLPSEKIKPETVMSDSVLEMNEYRQKKSEENLAENIAIVETEQEEKPTVDQITDSDKLRSGESKTKTEVTKIPSKTAVRSKADTKNNMAASPSPTIKKEGVKSADDLTTEDVPLASESKEKIQNILEEDLSLDLYDKAAPSKLQSATSEPLTAESEKIETVSEASDNMLGYWQNTVVSNQMVLDNQKKQTIVYKKAVKKGADSDRQVVAIRDERELYNQMFEGYYNIALLTDDSTERREAIANLKKYARDLGFNYSAEANNFLYKYDSVQSLLNRIEENK